MKVIKKDDGTFQTIGVYIRQIANKLSRNNVKISNAINRELSDIYHEKGLKEMNDFINANYVKK